MVHDKKKEHLSRCEQTGCGFVSRYPKDLRRHQCAGRRIEVARHTGRNDGFDCNVRGCNGRFHRKDNLLRHQRACHSDLKHAREYGKVVCGRSAPWGALHAPRYIPGRTFRKLYHGIAARSMPKEGRTVHAEADLPTTPQYNLLIRGGISQSRLQLCSRRKLPAEYFDAGNIVYQHSEESNYCTSTNETRGSSSGHADHVETPGP